MQPRPQEQWDGGFLLGLRGVFADCSAGAFLSCGGVAALILGVDACLKAVLGWGGHGKSPCFSQVTFLQLVGPDYPQLILSYIDGADCLE